MLRWVVETTFEDLLESMVSHKVIGGILLEKRCVFCDIIQAHGYVWEILMKFCTSMKNKEYHDLKFLWINFRKP
jgi:hypothetical protein